MQEIEEPIDWTREEFFIPPEYDAFIDDCLANGIAVNYILHFWDKAGRAEGNQLSVPRFKEDGQIQDFIEYTRFVVEAFKGRVQYYTIWSEPDACGGSNIKCIEPEDYINLVKQVIPVIKEIDPSAQVVTAPNVLFFDRDYLFQLIASEAIPLFDVISWHGIYDAVPGSAFYGNYYYEYPQIVEDIKQTANDQGFQGEFWGTRLTWCSNEYPTCHAPDQPWEMQATDKIAAKYDARGFIIHLGMDVGIGWGGLESVHAPWSYPTVRNLNTIMNNARPISHGVVIENEPPNTATYAFTLPGGDTLFAFWINDVAVDETTGQFVNIFFPGSNAEQAFIVDVLEGDQQELDILKKNNGLRIENVSVVDYPLLIRLSKN